jgi:hypothetical protein
VPTHDVTPTERLTIELPGPHAYRQSSWTDGARHRLEDQLPKILQEIEIRGDAAERARLDAEERRRQQELEEQRRLELARHQRIESHRAEVLMAQLADWQSARQLTEYLDAMATAISAQADKEKAEQARAWLKWGRRYAARLDPLQRPLAMPDPEPTLRALSPHLSR